MSWRNKFGIYQHRNGIKTTRMGRIIKEKVQMKKNTNERALKNFNSGGLGKREETTKKRLGKIKGKPRESGVLEIKWRKCIREGVINFVNSHNKFERWDMEMWKMTIGLSNERSLLTLQGLIFWRSTLVQART